MPAFVATAGAVTVTIFIAPAAMAHGAAAVQSEETEYGLAAPSPNAVHHERLPDPVLVMVKLSVAGVVPQGTKPGVPPPLPNARVSGLTDRAPAGPAS